MPQVEETSETLLALAAANRLLDAPQWYLVEDKCSLDELLKAMGFLGWYSCGLKMPAAC